eukprot:TRINITY_DN9264_c0_g1_i11.p4 TRINITY_DN9264_c0_g1~~TRINITY_DN9264_c0_g1_i11.p4  ORF type:complete len:105 (-),score=14.74 TRINITY_DN9264_c0_g1_i11:243-557(-)
MLDCHQRMKEIELDAYKSLLRAFYQHQHSWKKEKLLKEIRQCFNLSHDVHDKLLEEIMMENQQPQQQQRVGVGGGMLQNRPRGGDMSGSRPTSGNIDAPQNRMY